MREELRQELRGELRADPVSTRRGFTRGSSTPGFTHLHARSGFSYGYGTATPEELAEGAAAMGYSALALTDRGGLYGVPRFSAACAEHGVLPIVGAEIPVRLDPVQLRKLREVRKVSKDAGPSGAGAYQSHHHVVVLAASQRGYRSLCSLISSYRLRCKQTEHSGSTPEEQSEENVSGREPACDLWTLAEHAGGLLCLTGAIPFGLGYGLASGRVSGALDALGTLDTGAPDKNAARTLGVLREVFGEDGLYVELTHDGTAGSGRRVRLVEALAERCGLPTVAAGEVTYLRPEDHRIHEVLAAAGSPWRPPAALPPPGYRSTDRLYLRTAREMERLFSERPEALQNARELAQRCAGAVRPGSADGEVLAPAANLSAGESAGRKLLALTLRGARERYPGAFSGEAGAFPSRAELKARLRREISCIVSAGYSAYFLIAAEAVEIARGRGVPTSGRGSAANSVVVHCLGLTSPDPFEHRGLFERFLNERRKDPPDIDLDLDSEYRDEIRDELMRRYSHRGCAVAATAQSYSLRGAVRLACRALGYSPSATDELARGLPRSLRGADRSAAGASDESRWDAVLRSPPMRGSPLRDRRRYALLLELAQGLEGRLARPGTHLGGLVFGTPQLHLSRIVPLEPGGKPGLTRLQYDRDGLEYLGIPKLDLLGSRIHAALRKAGEMASTRLGEEVDPLSPAPDDRETYERIRSGRGLAGVFQLESPGQLSLSRRLKPRRLEHLIAQISLFRPGPLEAGLVSPFIARKNGRMPYSVPLPALDEILKSTYGVLVYQEQLMEIVGCLASCTLAEADALRKAMKADTDPGRMRRLGERFTERAIQNGVAPETAREVFGWLSGFGRYGFSRAHAASFAGIAYASAFALTHYPAEYLAGVLNSQPMGFYSPRVLAGEARRRGISLLPADLRYCGDGFTVEEAGTALRVGLSYCRGLSQAGIESLLEERERAPFEDLADLDRRSAVHRDALENLIRAGFVDHLHPSGSDGRPSLLTEAQRLPRSAGRRPTRPPQQELPHPGLWWRAREGRRPEETVAILHSQGTAAARDRDQARVLGVDLPGHPLSAHRAQLQQLGCSPTAKLPLMAHGSRARVGGLLECLQSPPTAKKPVWFLLMEDEAGLLQCTIFEDVYRKWGPVLYESVAYLVDGRVEHDPDRGFSFVVERVADLAEALRQSGKAATPKAAPLGQALRRGGERRAG